MPLFKKGISKDQKKLLQDKIRLATEKPDSIFDLSACGIKQIPDGVFSKCKVLRKQALLLHQNEIDDLKHGGDVHNLEELLILDLSANKFTTIPKSIQYLRCLQKLDLSHNKLKKVPEEIGALHQLQELNLSNNEISDLPHTIKHLTNLHSFDITVNKFLYNLPVNLCYLSNLETFKFDYERITYPSKEITVHGIKEIQRWFKKVKGDEFEDDDSTDGLPKGSVSVRMAATEIQSNNFEKAILERERQKDLKNKNRLNLEQEILDSKTENAKLLTKMHHERQEMLAQIEKNEQNAQVALAKQFDEDKADRHKLLEQLYLEENHLEETVNLVLQMSERARQTDQLLEEIEHEQSRIDALVKVTVEESERLRKQEMIDAMNHVLKEMAESEKKWIEYELKKDSILKKSLKEAEEDQEGLELVLLEKDQQQQALLADISTEEEKQKQAFLVLQLQKDVKLNRIKKQVDMIEGELARLSILEVEKRKEQSEQEMIALAEMRVQTAMLLSQLIDQQQERETRLKKTIQQMEQEKEEDMEDFWLIQFQRLMDTKPQVLVDKENCLDTMVVEVLLNANAREYLPHFARHKIDEEKLLKLSKEDIRSIGVKDSNHAEDILASIKILSLQVENLNKQEVKLKKSISGSPSTLPNSPSFDAPPLNSKAVVSESECVICLDRKPEVVLLTCGHVCVCSICCVPLRQCPLCREDIKQKCRLFGI